MRKKGLETREREGLQESDQVLRHASQGDEEVQQELEEVLLLPAEQVVPPRLWRLGDWVQISELKYFNFDFNLEEGRNIKII